MHAEVLAIPNTFLGGVMWVDIGVGRGGVMRVCVMRVCVYEVRTTFC